MRLAKFPWRKAAYTMLLGAILFLTILPYFGFAWHRVLPEHEHVYFGVPQEDGADDLAPVTSSPASEPGLCLTCTSPQIGAGLIHLPGFMGAQILGIVVSVVALFSMPLPPDFPARLVPVALLYRSPLLSLLDPPPTLVVHPHDLAGSLAHI